MKVKVLLVACLSIVVALIVGCGSTNTSGMSNSGTQAQNNKQTSQNNSNVGKIGQPIRVGDIQWTLQTPTKETTIPSNNEFVSSAKAQGVFIIFDATVQQVGNQAGSLDPSQINLIDSKGRTFKPTDETDVEMLLSDKLITYKQLNPNVPVTVTCVFDVAADATGLKAEINSGGFTQSEKIDVPLGL